MQIWDLNQYPCAIALQGIGAGSTPVGEVFEDLEALFDHQMAFLTLNVSDKAQTTGVMLVLRVVEASGPRRD